MKPWRSLTAAALLAALSTSCTHNPITNERIADSFEGCMGVNTGLAIGLGLLVGKLTGSREGGAATALGTLLVAWHQCAQVHQKVVNTEEKSREEMQRSGASGPALHIDQLALTVGAPGEDINSVARYTVLSNDPAKKDIPVRETRTILVPRVVQDAKGQLYYANAQDKPLLDTTGRPMPVNGKTHHDPDALVYKDYSFPVENVVKQGMRKADGLLPTPKDLPDSLPYRFHFVVEAEGQRAEKEVAFRFGKPGQSAATFGSRETPHAATTTPATSKMPSAPTRANEAQPDSASGWSGAIKRSAFLRETPGGKTIGQVSPGTLLAVVEGTAVGAKDAKSSEWVRVRTELGAVGWLRKTEIKGLK